jgi:hypothetical protein
LSNEIDLKEIERRALTAYYEDGLLDIFIGGYLLFFGLSTFTEFEHHIVVVSWFLPVLSTLLYSEAKKRVTYPRLGYVRFTKEMRHRVWMNTSLVLFVAGLVTLTGLFTNMGVPESAPWGTLLLNKYNLLFLGGIFAVTFLMMGRIMSISRLYHYSVISLLVFFAGYFYLDSPFIVSEQSLGVPCAILGVIMVGIGASYLRRFIGMYPKEA